MIKVNEFYRGRSTGEQPIAPGVYSADDPALFGLADFLVESGRAERIGGEPTPAAEPQLDSQEGQPERTDQQGEAQPDGAQDAQDSTEVDADGNPVEQTSIELDETNRPQVKSKK